MILKICLKCKKEYQSKRKSRKFCSWECFGMNEKNKTFSEETLKKMSLAQKKRFKTMRHPLLNYKFSEEAKRKMSLSRIGKKPWNYGIEMPQIRGKNHFAWKGNKVGYHALHVWVKGILGEPTKCEFCKRENLINTKNNRTIHWANKSGKYMRKLTDWLRLCTKCHGAYDRNQRKLQLL